MSELDKMLGVIKGLITAGEKITKVEYDPYYKFRHSSITLTFSGGSKMQIHQSEMDNRLKDIFDLAINTSDLFVSELLEMANVEKTDEFQWFGGRPKEKED